MGRRSKGAGPELYDFRRPTKLAREHTRTLQMAYETFARQYTTVLTSSLRAISQVSLLSIEQLTYEEYIGSLSSPTIMAMLELDPLPGTSILEFSLGAGMAAIDHMLGGPGGPQPTRPLTDIETPLLQSMIDRCMQELRFALDPIVAIRPRVTGIEYNPQFAQAGTASDAMVVASFEMKIGEQECIATFCMPFKSIFPKLQGESGGVTLTPVQRLAREEAYRNVVAGLSGAPLEVAVTFQPVRMRAKDLMDLRPGDVVPLTHPSNAPLTVNAADITFGYAVPGSQGARLACLVVAPPKEDELR
jgi:flagellar motor switch protein FliM